MIAVPGRYPHTRSIISRRQFKQPAVVSPGNRNSGAHASLAMSTEPDSASCFVTPAALTNSSAATKSSKPWSLSNEFAVDLSSSRWRFFQDSLRTTQNPIMQSPAMGKVSQNLSRRSSSHRDRHSHDQGRRVGRRWRLRALCLADCFLPHWLRLATYCSSQTACRIRGSGAR